MQFQTLKNNLRFQQIALFVVMSLGLSVFFYKFIPSQDKGYVTVLAVLLFVVLFCFVEFFRNPVAVLIMVLFLFPLDVSKWFFPYLRSGKTILGEKLSQLDLNRLTVATVLLVWLTVQIRQKRFVIPWNKFVRYAFYWIVLVAISGAALSSSKTFAIKEVVRFSVYFGYLLMLATTIRSTKDVEALLVAILIIGVGLSLTGFILFALDLDFWNGYYISIDGVKRMTVTFSNPNLLGRYLTSSIIVALTLSQRSLGYSRPLMFAAIAICLAALFMTHSRGAVLVLFCSVIFFFNFGKSFSVKRNFLLFVAVFLLLAMVVLFLPQILSRLLSLTNANAYGTRVVLLVTGLKMFAAHPIFGVGVGDFTTVAAQFDEMKDHIKEGVQASHAEALTVLAEMGLVGASIFTYIGIQLFREAANMINRQKDPKVAVLILGLSTCVCNIVLSAQIMGNMFYDMMFWFYLGVLGYLRHTSTPTAKIVRQPKTEIES